ncbi:hypothetical protein L5515_010778 [Caenorhabditis briggsae]|uniref:Copper transport protein n=1 Tax=Caenorhabditis briggsae TaxID=6238 RepID=A0AAE9A7Y8_CAEBR|nr:hypothetical protein L3Y34_003626 [Caenorhabditis briggsae]UMM27512.1 hypothetical protein L5515_010778 [Caenorhabditis briggsae]
MMMEMSTHHGMNMMNMTTMAGPVAKRHKMWMWYHVEVEDTVLFKSWTVFDAGTMVWTCFVIAAAGICLEALKYARWATGEHIKSHQENLDLKLNFWKRHVIDCCYHFWQLCLAYILMNVYMVFSVYICLSLCLGLAIGHFIFASRTGISI